jgi:type II secretory pathway predicted ATPase ExeA
MKNAEGEGLVSGQTVLGPFPAGMVSSRLRAFEHLFGLIRGEQAGPALVTGEPGSGKTWLARRLVEALPANWQAVFVDVSSAMNELDFLRVAGHGMGVKTPSRVGGARLRLHTVLRDELRDGRRWLLIVDEAHHSAPGVWEAVAHLANELGRAGGFSALLLLAETELARKLSMRPLLGLGTKLGGHVHLMPIDVDEARELLGLFDHLDQNSLRRLEELHRDARGNPSRLLHLAILKRWPWTARRREGGSLGPRGEAFTGLSLTSSRPLSAPGLPETSGGVGTTEAPSAAPARMSAPPLVPARPPIRLEEGLIEVGWEGDLEAEFEGAATMPPPQEPAPGEGSPTTEELIEDRVAALQAWKEWKQNQARLADGDVEPDPSGLDRARHEMATSGPVSATGQSGSGGHAASSLPTNVRAEGQHDYAPYSQLFTRLRQSRQPGG